MNIDRETFLQNGINAREAEKKQLELYVKEYSERAKLVNKGIEAMKAELAELEKAKLMPTFLLEEIHSDGFKYNYEPERYINIGYVIRFVSSGYGENFMNEYRKGNDLLLQKLMEVLKTVKL